MKVLHVDDNPAWLEFLHPLFRDKRWFFENALRGEQALGLLDKSFDLLIADYNMPGRLNGVDVVIEARRKGIRAIMFTSAPEEAKRELQQKAPELLEEVLFFTKGNNFALFSYLDTLL